LKFQTHKEGDGEDDEDEYPSKSPRNLHSLIANGRRNEKEQERKRERAVLDG